MAKQPAYVTKREMKAHEKLVKKMIKKAIADVKEWDKLQDKKFALRNKSRKR